jgi:hypothetical protein
VNRHRFREITMNALLWSLQVLPGAIGSHAYLREPRNVALTTLTFIAAVTVAIGTTTVR